MCAQLAETLIPEEENEKQVPVVDYFKESGQYCLHAFAQDAHEVNKKWDWDWVLKAMDGWEIRGGLQSVKSLLPLHQQTGVSLRFPTPRVLSTGAPWLRGAARNLRQLPDINGEKEKKMYYSCTNEAKKLEASPRKLLHYSNLNRIFCLFEARCALSLGALIGDRKLRRTPRYGTDENSLFSLLTVLKNWISSSPSPPSAMAVKEPAQTREATTDCRQKRDAVPVKPILAWSSSTAI